MFAIWSSIVLLLTTSPVAAHQQSLAEGVYTAEQAERGRTTFEERCRACHGDLRSTTGVRALVGDAFMADWSGLTLGDLLDRVRTMPPSEPRALDDESYVDLVAFLLQANGFPAGDHALRAADAPGVPMPMTDARPVNSSIVQILGCLSRGPGSTWALTNATDPLRTRNPDSSSGIERERLAGSALGSASFELLYVFPSPEPFEGRRVEVKGLLVEGTEHRVNVTALAGLGTDAGCNGSPQH